MDRDSNLIFEAYESFISLYEASLKPIILPKESLIGRKASIHPVVSVDPMNEDYMKWSVKIGGYVIGYASTIHLKDCYSEIKHHLIDKSIRSKEHGKGQKAPIILLEGIIENIDFPVEELYGIVKSGDWKSVTYNPHKNDEYIYRACLPDWWNSDERFWDVEKGKRGENVPIRQQAMIDRHKKFEDECTLSKRSGDISYFHAGEALLKQHDSRNEDYMWVRGVSN